MARVRRRASCHQGLRRLQLGDEEKGIAPARKQQKSALALFGGDITELARRGKLEPVIGRKDEILRVARILSQKRKANPVLVGEPGVGKTGIVEGLAQRRASSECPEFLRDERIVEISVSALIAGANSSKILGFRFRPLLTRRGASGNRPA